MEGINAYVMPLHYRASRCSSFPFINCNYSCLQDLCSRSNGFLDKLRTEHFWLLALKRNGHSESLRGRSLRQSATRVENSTELLTGFSFRDRLFWNGSRSWQRYILEKGSSISRSLNSSIGDRTSVKPLSETSNQLCRKYTALPRCCSISAILFIRSSNHVAWRLHQCYFLFHRHRPVWDPSHL